MKTAQEVVSTDLEYIASKLGPEFETMSGRSLLIIGGAGFLGYYLVQSVVHWNNVSGQAPIKITVFDNYMRGVPDWLKSIQDDDNVTLVTHDITEPLPDDMADFDYIIHAASIASPIYYRQHALKTMDANVGGLRYMLDYALAQHSKEKPIKGFLFFSTSEIYGDPTPESIPTPETYRGNVSCTGPRACYDESKRYGETLCVVFAQQYDLPITIARPFNNYGPGLKISDRRVLPDFARDIFAERDIVMFSDGAPTRTFCYVADAVCGYYKILLNGKPGEAYNIGIEDPEISMANLAERVIAIARDEFGYQGKAVFQVSEDKDYLVDNPNRRCPVIAKARSDIGYDPEIGVDEGLRRAMIWYSGNRDAEDM
ncbi:NAD-dependent epimerase/dehydratase family protein [Ruegeria atlantica]|uniref:NAD-dependent epimerase/dehydratase family protein n=1 Tax=Ruegeria atlantica TaxID=81569 RepID=UPI001C2C38B0